MKKTYKTIEKSLFSLLLLIAFVAAIACSFASCEKDRAKAPEVEKTITFTVTDKEGNSTDFVITTKAENLGEALVAEKLVEGEMQQYGMYVKKVNGIEADYEKNGAYWAFSKNGEYLMSGIDTTPIADGDKFAAVYTK